jgi:hypothetical protein
MREGGFEPPYQSFRTVNLPFDYLLVLTVNPGGYLFSTKVINLPLNFNEPLRRVI